MAQSYATTAAEYWQRGWRGVLPLPAGKKTPPPAGTTGHDGRAVSYPDIMAWTEDFPNGNLGLRLPPDVVGIDVDAHGGKRGDLTLAEAVKRWGELPPTVRSTSRINTPSGIYLYRCPSGVEFDGGIKFAELGLGGIDIIQHVYRYCVSWPSVHPDTDRQYLWVNHDGSFADIPRPAELPRLPDAWVAALTKKSTDITADVDVAEALKNLPAGAMSMRVAEVKNKGITDLAASPGSRHEDMLKHVGALLRLADEGETGVLEALGLLHDEFVKVVGRDRGTDAAHLEFERMLKNPRIHNLIASTPGDKKSNELIGLADKIKQQGPVVPIHPEVVAEQTRWELPPSQELDEADLAVIFGNHSEVPNTSDPSEDELIFGTVVDWNPEPEEGENEGPRTSWGAIDFGVVLDGDLTPEDPKALLRSDGAYLAYEARINSFIGEPGGGKSWVAMLAAAQVLNDPDGGAVMMLDFEDTKKSIANRLLSLGVPRQALATRFGYANPEQAPNSDAFEDIARDLNRFRPALIIVDGVNAAMTLMGLELKENTDANKFHQVLLKPLTALGSTIITIDHVAKSRESRNGYAIGAQAKKAMADGVVIEVRAKDKFGRGKMGKLELFLQKDKHGGVQAKTKSRGNQGDYLATFVLDARIDGALKAELYFDDKEEVDERGIPKGEQRLIAKMIEISNYLARNDPERQGISKNKIALAVPGKESEIMGALNQLVEIRHVEERKGARGAKLQVLLSPYAGPVDDELKLILGAAPGDESTSSQDGGGGG